MTAVASRYRRYKTVLDCVVSESAFDIRGVQERCADEAPSFVTRVVHELERAGWILRESSDVGNTFRWNRGRGEFSADHWLDEKLFGSQIRGTPVQERPRERLLAEGVQHLRNAELMAILIRSGRPGESAVMAGDKLARTFAERMQDLPSAGRAELKSISSAIEKTAYCQLMAGIELGRRVSAASAISITRIRSAADAIGFCRSHFARLAVDGRQEEFHTVTLDTKNQVITTHRITVGTLNASLVHPREVFRPAIRDAAAAVILVHNHPSGDPTPSREDHAVTRRLESAGELLGIDVLDHIVLGRADAVSLRQVSN